MATIFKSFNEFVFVVDTAILSVPPQADYFSESVVVVETLETNLKSTFFEENVEILEEFYRFKISDSEWAEQVYVYDTFTRPQHVFFQENVSITDTVTKGGKAEFAEQVSISDSLATSRGFTEQVVIADTFTTEASRAFSRSELVSIKDTFSSYVKSSHVCAPVVIPTSFTLGPIELPAPEFEDTIDVEPARIYRQTRGNDLEVYRSNEWPEAVRYRYTFKHLKKDVAYRVLDYLRDNAGKDISITYRGPMTVTVVKPDAKITELFRPGLSYDLELEFEQ